MHEAHDLVDSLCDAIEEAQGNAKVPSHPFAPKRGKKSRPLSRGN
jgi:hypothetical protein